MFAAEVVWTQREYDASKGKEVNKLKTNVVGFADKSDAMHYVDDFAEGLKKLDTMTFKIGKVYEFEVFA